MMVLKRELPPVMTHCISADYVLDLSTGGKANISYPTDGKTTPVMDRSRSPIRDSSPQVDPTYHRQESPRAYDSNSGFVQEEMAMKTSDYCLPLRGSPVYEGHGGKISPTFEADSGYSLSPRSYKGESDGSLSPPPSSLVQRVLDAPSAATRPFKAYPRNPLALGHDDAFLQFREQMLSKVRSLNKNNSAKARHQMNNNGEDKDAAYWERRRKNNEAAKRSRDARRAKEDEIAIRAAFLEQENLRLKYELTSLKEETCKLKSLVYNNNPLELLQIPQVHALHSLNHLHR